MVWSQNSRMVLWIFNYEVNQIKWTIGFHIELSTKQDDYIYLLKGGFQDKGSVVCQSFIIRFKLGMSCPVEIFSHWSWSCFILSITNRQYFYIQELSAKILTQWPCKGALAGYERITRRWEMFTQAQRASSTAAVSSHSKQFMFPEVLVNIEQQWTLKAL